MMGYDGGRLLAKGALGYWVMLAKRHGSRDLDQRSIDIVLVEKKRKKHLFVKK